MKKTIITLLVATVVAPLSVFAMNNDVYYTNLAGAELTKAQYENLSKAFSEDTIATMTPEIIDVFKDETGVKTMETTKYVKVEERLDLRGNVIDYKESEVSEEEANAFVENQKNGVSPLASSATYQTGMKKLTLRVTSASASGKAVTLNNTWLSIPVVKSFDVIALMPKTLSATIGSNSISGYQKWNGNMIYYEQDGDNTKIQSAGLFQKYTGFGISMNIVDETSYSLENQITALFLCSNNEFTIRGSYQHATSDVTLSQSKDYTINPDGLGGVLNFSSSVKSKYDAMGGVELTYYYGDEL